MKITMNNGITFEGTQAEYEEFLAYAERKIAEDEAKEAKALETIEFEGATYRKVDREARKGDVVIFTDETAYRYFITKNQPYKVIADGKFIDNDGDRMTIYRNDGDQNRTRETVDVYEPIEQAKYVPQEGDIVVITDDSASNHSLGDIGKITEVKVDTFRVTVPGKKNRGNWLMDFRFRKATPAEVEKYEQALMEIEKAHKDTEIAEKWAKIGRKPNEFKKGDVVKARTLWIPSEVINDHIGIIEDEGYDMVGIKFGNGRYCGACITDGNVELITPVESLFK